MTFWRKFITKAIKIIAPVRLRGERRKDALRRMRTLGAKVCALS